MRSYRSAIVAKMARVTCRLPFGVDRRSRRDFVTEAGYYRGMLPSSTVENYLKAIYHGQSQLGGDARLVPMGQVATALNITPGTATTMVKALAESGLAEYEPYSGVRLTAAGQTLAALVLRRHRLVELFLVQVMGMSWAEVHDEAELDLRREVRKAHQ